MNQNNDVLSANLRQEISESITKELDLSKPAVLQYTIIYDDDRRLYKITVEGRAEFFVLKVRGLKVVKQQDHDIDDLKKEFYLLENAWSCAKSMPSGFGLSKPITLWVEEKSMLLSGCKGGNFNDWFNKHLFKWIAQSRELKLAINRCGFWLGSYHKLASKRAVLKNKFDTRADNLHRMLEFLKTNQRHKLPNKTLDAVESNFLRLVSAETEGPVAQVHGNFAYRNILFSDNEINLVDFEDAHMEHVAFDIGQFLAEVAFKSQFPWLRHLTKGLTHAFKSGYQEPFEMQESITSAYLGYHLIVHLYEHCSRKKPHGLSSVILSYRIRYLSKLVRKWSVNLISSPTF